MKSPKLLALIILLLLTTSSRGRADELTNRLARFSAEVVKQFSAPIEDWRFSQPDVDGGEQPDFNDSAWQKVSPGFSWSGADQSVWFRAKISIPAKIAGQSVEGRPVRLDIGMNCRCELYVNGQLREAFRGNNGLYTLAVSAQPGQTFDVTLRGIKGQADSQFHYARLFVNTLPELDQYLDDITFLNLLMDQVPAEKQAVLKKALSASESEIQFAEITPADLQSVRAQFAKGLAALQSVAAITRNYDVYYIGHAHIDMNWQWPWTETIDVCHRTWNSAMNLMDEFPNFYFVQSQPGAYVPIEKEYPQEFARMQSMAARGQWDPVGGLWDESDTDIPSGEALARSFMLGQRYFKSKFGKYAVTGWLPDSFGHTWQLPQIMQLVGIRNFYHMRCGNGMEFTWWQSPDGSRVLKANTQPYDAKPKIDQLVVPMKNESRFGLPQSVTIFGVGDHGGGPTREQILRIQSFQQNPIFPRIHFISADAFFDQLAKQPAAASLPVVDSGLQYIFQGCYTTHADIKKAIRSSEDGLYSAEVLTSMAAMMGQPYLLDAFNEAWKPTAFAQFHDIACGSAIHSTYDWMHEQLAPAFHFEEEQTDKSLRFLTATIDTRGPATNAIAVWNTLSFSRDDVVKVSIADAKQYHSVVDQDGQRFPAQSLDDSTLVFVARDVPAFGHAVYFPEPASGVSDGAVLSDVDDVYEVQTPSLTLQINKTTGAIARLYSKIAKWDVFAGAHDADAWQLLGDSGTSWTIRYTGTDKILTTEGAKVSVVDQGPVFDRLRVIHAEGKSTYTQDLIVYGALPRIDIPTTVNWQEEHELLKIRLPVNATNTEATSQIPFGNAVRPTNGRECPGQKWMDISEMAPAASTKPSEPLYGLSVLNDCKYGFDVSSNVFRLTALRSAPRPDPHPDQGMQQFTYSLYPHAGGWRAAHTDEKALGLNIPLLAMVTQPHAPADAVPSFSLTNIGGKGDLIVTAIKHGEDGDGFILRFYEADGQDTRARIDFGRPVHVQETDILERPITKHPITNEGDAVALPVGHNQIVTLHITFAL